MTIQGVQHRLPVTDPADEVGATVAVRDLIRELAAAAAANPRPTTRPESVAGLVVEYLDAIAHTVAPRTRVGYASYLRAFVARFGALAAADITADAVEKQAAREAWSDSNRANYLWSVQAFLRWCGATAFRTRRPARDSRGAESVITEDTHRLVLREARGDFHELVRLLWATGCRPMEAARLTAEGIDWPTATAKLRHHKTRGKGKGRTLFFGAEAMEILVAQAARYQQAGPLFRGQKGEPFSRQAIVTRMIRISARIGRPVSAYCYRHTFATRALEQGIPDTHVAALMGHSNTNMLHRHYSHVVASGRLLRGVADQVNRKPPPAAA